MNRRKFFRAAASFVAGCAIGLGMRPKIEPFPHLIPNEEVFKYHTIRGLAYAMYAKQVVSTQDYEATVCFSKDVKQGVFASAEGVRSITYRQVDGEWIKDESTRKA